MTLDTHTVYLLLLLAAIHYVGDFILQADRVARAKSKCNLALTEHVAHYTAVLVVCTGWIDFALLNGALHWVTDWVTSRINARLWAAGRTHDFFVGVGADQTVHYATLYLTALWLLS